MSKIATYCYCFLGSFVGNLVIQLFHNAWDQRETDWPRFIGFTLLFSMAMSAHWVLISEWLRQKRVRPGKHSLIQNP